MVKQRQVRRGTRNPELIPGIRRRGHSAADSARGAYKHSKKGDTRTAEQKKAALLRKQQCKDITKSRFYSAEDESRPLRTNRAAAKSAKLKKSITAGTVLIVLAGRFRGKRVVFLKQLKSGLLLVTGPFSINGVPIRRINQAYTIATSTKLDISKIDVSKIEDSFFARVATDKSASKKEFLESKSNDKSKSIVTAERKAEQKRIDTALLPLIKAVPNLGHYLNAKFTLTNGQRPHLLKF